jgi:hypothetical protein
MVLVHQDPVMVLTTGVTSATRMLPVLADTAVTGGHVSPLLSVLVGASRHIVVICAVQLIDEMHIRRKKDIDAGEQRRL